ncbi:MAG: peptidoglycan recognition family protein [Bacteroidota bacterium]
MRFVFALPAMLLLTVAGCTPRPSSFDVPDPAPVDRTGWSAAPTRSMADNGPIRHVTVHHTYTEVGPDGEAAHVRAIQTMHQGGERQWGDIAYHYLIGPSGTVYVGRDEAFVPASGTVYLPDALRDAAGQDSLGGTTITTPPEEAGTPMTPPGASAGHITISVIGNYEEALPPPAQRTALVRLVADRLHAHGLTVDDVRFHREVAVGTACPGQALYDWFRGPTRTHPNRGDGLRQVEVALAVLQD